MKNLLREPLVHFILLGMVIFVVYELMSGRADEPGTIQITQQQMAAMTDGFTLTWQRAPTREELDGLIRDRVREEVYFREAIAMGLDKDDTIIRRRLRQKLEFITDDVVALAEPTDDELRSYLTSHPDLFREERRYTFRHVYLSLDRRGENLTGDAEDLLARLRRVDGADSDELGDPLMIERSLVLKPASEIGKLFGEPFVTELDRIHPGRWEGPIESGYGAHLVIVTERTEERVPELAEVRDAVRRAWVQTRRLEANEQFYRELLKRYEVVVETIPPAAGDQALATAEK